MGSGDVDRRGELAQNLMVIRERVAAACAAAGRKASEVTLVAVTKTWPAADVIHLAALGVHDVGENRDQEAAPKAAAVAAAGADVRWHFVGQLQRNKCRSVVTYAGMVESVDEVRLVDSLAEAVLRRGGPPLDVLVQVSIDGDPARGGAIVPDTYANPKASTIVRNPYANPHLHANPNPNPTANPRTGAPGGDTPAAGRELMRVLTRVEESAGLNLRGLMAVAPLGWDPAVAYERLARIAEQVRGQFPRADVLSAGMSGDFELAINYGATHVRVGSALLGNRALLM